MSAVNVRERVRANLAHWMRQRPEVTQEALAKSIGKTQPFVSQLLRGERSVSLDTLAVLAEVLRVDPSELLRDRTAEERGLPSPHGLAHDGARSITALGLDDGRPLQTPGGGALRQLQAFIDDISVACVHAAERIAREQTASADVDAPGRRESDPPERGTSSGGK